MAAFGDVLKLVSVCKNLGLLIKGERGKPGALIVTGNRAEFPDKLWDVADILKRFQDDEPSQAQIPEIMADAMLACMAAQGMDVRDATAISRYFLDGMEPRYNRKALMAMISNSEKKLRGLGNAAPGRRPIIRKATPTPPGTKQIKVAPSKSLTL